MDKQSEEDIRKKYSEMGRAERRRIYKANKKHLNGMSFTEFNKILPKKKEQK